MSILVTRQENAKNIKEMLPVNLNRLKTDFDPKTDAYTQGQT